MTKNEALQWCVTETKAANYYISLIQSGKFNNITRFVDPLKTSITSVLQAHEQLFNLAYDMTEAEFKTLEDAENAYLKGKRLLAAIQSDKKSANNRK